jgi:DNA-binding CsgD family transcriptional regulator/tetratricopeptide (TPR) repeat protein
MGVPTLRGRRVERETLERLLDAARAGTSSIVVVHGEAGCGKTALLDVIAERASDFRVARVVGVESEMELAFAGLHQLCAPMLDRVEHLPVPQRDALRVAFGLAEGDAPDRFLLGLAVLTLLADLAEAQPLACLIDDAQWLDRASMQVLAFVARRAVADRLALVFSVRDPGEEPELMGLPELAVSPLAESDARLLLGAAVRGRLDDRVRDRIIAEARGNPLALVQLPRGLTAAELAGGFGLPSASAVAGRVERSFGRQVQALPEDTRRLLLTAAAEPTGDVTLLWRAGERQGIDAGAASLAQVAGLLELGARVRFRHPLVRSAVYQSAPAGDRRAAHRALAEVTDPESDPDRRAWHRARAAEQPDEAVADELARAAERAQARGGLAAAAAFLERAAELTPDPARRGARALAAAQAELGAGAPDRAHLMLATAEMGSLDELQRARLERLRAQLAFSQRRGNDAPALLLHAAHRLAPLDAALARETYLEALGAAIFAGRLDSGVGVPETADAVRGVPAAADPRAVDLLLDGLATRFTDGYADAVPGLRRALDAVSHAARHGEDVRWLWLACRVATDLWDDERWHELATRQLRSARDAGALSVLPIALTYRAGVAVHSGEFAAAAAMIDEAEAISQATGNAPLRYTSLVLAAWRGDETQALELIRRSRDDATDRGEGRAITLAEYVTAVLYNGLGRYPVALSAAKRAADYDSLGLRGWALIELIEAAARAGDADAATSALRQLDERARASGTDWALGVAARSRALLTDGKTAEDLYREAVERLGRTRIAIHLARSRLVYGEWLRREHRNVDAREQLRDAHGVFSRVGAAAFAERARHELLATGETVRKRVFATIEELTPQERHIARLAGEGLTNPEIGAQLFISPRTVEWHLGKVFTKLDISSRKELRRAMSEPGRAASPA